jgi:hypothetical protein
MSQTAIQAERQFNLILTADVLIISNQLLSKVIEIILDDKVNNLSCFVVS